MGLNFFSVDEIGPNILTYVQNFIQKGSWLGVGRGRIIQWYFKSGQGAPYIYHCMIRPQ